jgi:hypothetical protein
MIDISKLKELAVSESGLIFDPTTGTIYTSNSIGLLILSALREGKEDLEIRNLILNDYDVDELTAERDLYDFYNQLRGSGMVKNA